MIVALGCLATCLLAAVAAFAWQRPVLGRLALRSALRRKGEALLVVAGCMIGTVIVTSSLLVGDTLESSMGARAPATLGPVDVVVSTYVAPVAEAAETTLTSDPPATADGVLAATTSDATLATLESSGKRQVVPSARLMEVDFAEAATFGGDPGATGISGPTPAPGEVVLAADAAEKLGVDRGDTVEVHAYGQFRLLQVDRILQTRGIAGYASAFDTGSMNAFVAPGTISEMTNSASVPDGARPPEHLVLVSGTGDTFSGARRTDALVEQIRERLGTLVGYEINPVKQDLLRVAAEEGRSFSELFLSLGAFAILAGAALLINTFVMLSEERRRELGILRSLGLDRFGLQITLVLEGALYSVVASVVGVVVGVGVAGLVVVLAQGVFASPQRGGVEVVRFGMEPATLLLGFLGGLVVSLTVVAVASIVFGRMSVTATIQNFARSTRRRERGWVRVASALVTFGLVVASVIAIAARNDVGSLLLPCLALASLSLSVLQIPARHGDVRRTLRGTVISCAAAVAMLWVVLAFVVLPLSGDDTVLFVLQGLVLALAAVVLVTQHQARVGWLLRRPGGSTGLVLRLALAYPSARRLRTGTTLLAYGLIVFSLVFSLVLSALFSSQERDLVADEAGGFDVLASTTGTATPVTMDELVSFRGVESVATLDWTVADFRVGTSGNFEEWAFSGFDEALIRGGAPAIDQFDETKYPNEGAVWEAVLRNPELAVADVAFLERGGGPPEGNVGVGDEIQVRSPVTGETSSRKVVAVSAAGAAFSGVLVSKESFGRLFDDPVVNRHYVAATRGQDPGALAAELERAFLSSGLEARSFEEIVEQALRDQAAFFDLIEGYLALGLFIGIIGLGVTMLRAVRERRREIGVLRVLGFTAWSVRATILAEAAVVAVEGVLIGTGLALATSYGLVTNSSAFGDIEVAYVVPWPQVAFLLTAVTIASLFTALPSTIRAAAVPPAAALRTAEEGAG